MSEETSHYIASAKSTGNHRKRSCSAPAPSLLSVRGGAEDPRSSAALVSMSCTHLASLGGVPAAHESTVCSVSS